MRLEKIKLAGFKSFVDPTTVSFPSNLVGIVGPNGCGKSNVIDAVRWVMGESSAKMLRGDSMADVIFNGSSTRKPVGTASIEMVFDNGDGGAGGQYAQYAQISVKRQVSRDGQSSYYLNGVKCRRRDIADLFLGTGLGPRSYSIIEQGMISRLIEARPEDLRAYLEEAAGISKYKERRRETERRIEHTRDNLSRLNDLRDEVKKQLRHLERQAATAEKYRELKAEERQVKAELLCLRLAAMDVEVASGDRAIAEQENRLQSAIADQRRLEVETEQQRDAHVEANDAFNEIQGRFYAVGAEIARLEEAIQFARASRRRERADLEQTERALAEAREHTDKDEGQLSELGARLDEDLPRLEEARARANEAGERLAGVEGAMQAWQSRWDEFNHQATEPAQVAQVERARINQLEQQQAQLKRRLERVEEDKRRLADVELDAEIAELERLERERELEAGERADALRAAGERIAEVRAGIARHQRELADARAELETLKGRLASLHALQQAARGSDDDVLEPWLTKAGLDSAPRLLEQVTVSQEWQVATERVLGHLLQAVVGGRVADAAGVLSEFAAGRLDLLEADGPEVVRRRGTLGALVECPPRLTALLNQVHVAATVHEALERLPSLEAHESLVTPDGTRFGPGWLRVRRDEDATAGVLAREQEIRELTARHEALAPLVDELVESLETGQDMLADFERRRDEGQRSLDAANRKLGELRAQLSGKRARAEQIRHRIEALDGDAIDLRQQLAADLQGVEEARQRLHEALERVEELAVRREELVARREDLRRDLEAARQQAFAANNRAHEIALRVESMRSSEQSLRSGMDRTRAQVEQLAERCERMRETIAAGEGPLERQQADLDAKLQVRVEVEASLAAARRTLEDIDHRVRDLEQRRHGVEEQVQRERTRLDELRMSRQELIVRGRTLAEQLGEMQLDRVDVVAELAEDAEVQAWESRVEQLAARIQRLGPINLAAIDEFKEQGERMEYLERQHADISESLETLENAIRKIDRETRTRFKETFDRVNNGLKELFPKLFGGGHAYLELTGEDLLDTGVTVMARPPGKRNSSIHLLSGGEKAMSAVALVFAIFQLNPAPFCMLDEVDAPLDDANVGRFCAMVKEMSETVQFVFITHNKVTMEIAYQLSGVTMHEPGVSRLVSVDVDEAAALAAV
jgi:chromosome segregation protein